MNYRISEKINEKYTFLTFNLILRVTWAQLGIKLFSPTYFVGFSSTQKQEVIAKNQKKLLLILQRQIFPEISFGKSDRIVRKSVGKSKKSVGKSKKI